jgi:hypothetical protein
MMDKDNDEIFPPFEHSCFCEAWLGVVLTGQLTKEQITGSLQLARAIYDRVANRVLDHDIEF